MTENALELRDVVVEYERQGGGRVRAVAGVNLAVGPGRIVGLVGESGCGKSSLARAAVGLVRPTAGTILFQNRPVTPVGRRTRPRALVRLQLVSQNPYSSLNPRRTAGSQIADALGSLDLASRSDFPARARELCELVGVPASSVDRFPHELSGGQRQRVALARALAANPAVLVLDEPFASLDSSAQARLANLFVHLSSKLRLALLVVSHDLAIVRHVADEVSVMYLGTIVESGPIQAVWDLPLHPYTEALMRACPHPDGEGTLPEVLSGEVPDPTRPPAGCRFHPRCGYVLERCREETPQRVELTGGRTAACWLQPAGALPDSPASRSPRGDHRGEI